MGRIKRGGYLIEWWIGDHWPKHVHVYKDGREVTKIRIPEMIVLSGKANRRIRTIIRALIRERKI